MILPFRSAQGAPGVVLDGSFGTSGALPGPNYLITAPMGRTVGTNLFQSFGSFNLTSAESATFTGPPSIQNILARVTGGSASSIDGTINSSIAGANLFLLNPSGIMFGPHAQVNVTGSFAAGTADYVKLADGGKFNTSLGGADNLTSAPVSAFGFLAAHPAPVTMNGTFLTGATGQGMHIIAGDVSLNNSEVDAPGGILSIFSAASAGEVPFDLATAGSQYGHATNASFGNVSITNASYIDIDGPGGGNLVIRGGHITVDDSIVSSFNAGSVVGGNISLQANLVAIQDGAEVESVAGRTGAAGNISVQATSVTIDGTDAPAGFNTGILSFSDTANTGVAGNIDVEATGAVHILNGGLIQTISSGPGGNITLRADSLALDGSGTAAGQTTEIDAESIASAGPAGLVNIDIAHALSITGGAVVSSLSIFTAAGPALSIHAGSMTIDGENSPDFTGVESESGGGEGGSVTVNIDDALTINNGGSISSSAFSTSSGGSIEVHAGSVTLTGPSTAGFVTGIQSVADAGGNAGAVSVTADGAMTLSSQATISSLTFDAGAAGDISVHAGSLNLSGISNILSSSESFDVNSLALGDTGSVSVDVGGNILIEGGALIGNFTASLGNAGLVNVRAGAMTIDGDGLNNLFTGIASQTGTGAVGNAGAVTVTVAGGLAIVDGGGISSNTFSSGNGADVEVRAGSLMMNGDHVSGLTGISSNANSNATGNGGSLRVIVDGNAALTGGAEISTSTFSAGNSGVLNVTIDGKLTITDGAEISGGTFSSGASGAMFVTAGSLFIDSQNNGHALTGISDQSNSGATGNAGPLTIDVAGAVVLTDGGEISSGTRSTGNGGDVTLNAGSLTIEDAQGSTHLTGISSETDGTTDLNGNLTGIGGNAGSVTVDIQGALVMTGGKIDTDTFCFGNAGNVTVSANTLSIDGSSVKRGFTGIFSDSNGFVGDTSDRGGNAGTVLVDVAGGLLLTGTAKIGAATFTTGVGGDIDIHAGSLGVYGAFSGVTAQALGFGDSGSIVINAGNVVVADNGSITTSSLFSNAGSIVINAGTNLVLQDHATINTAAAVDGGSITLNVGTLLYALNSKIVAAAGNNGGNILIDPEFVVLNNSVISANAAAGQGGNITIISDFFLNQGSLITATGNTNDGIITITAPNFDLAGNLLVLPGDLVQADKELRERCARALNHEFSSLIVVGRGGVETPPDELQPDFGIDSGGWNAVR
jgi:filamentous hemagglutinin family protein